uniref:Solute carrier family 25 member 23 n=1 Tax=Pelodiscus sinensis TaxID=13735 RepID=K7FZ02_PELSI
QEILREGDTDQDGELDFEEFARYLQERERKLLLMFHSLDRNNDGGALCCGDQQVFAYLVDLSLPKISKVLWVLLKVGSLHRETVKDQTPLILSLLENMEEVVHYWKHSMVLDIGECLTVPDEFSEKEKKTGMWWKQLLAGAMAGAVSRTGTAPLDRLKVFMQSQAPLNADSPPHPTPKTVPLDYSFCPLEGGAGTANWKMPSGHRRLIYCFSSQIKRGIRGQQETLRVQERFVAGSLAGATAQTIIYPMEVLKTRLTLRKTGQYAGMADCAKKILRKEGLRAFYKGYLPNVLGIIPYAGIDLAIYETLKNMWLQKYSSHTADPGILVLLACGTVSSTCGQIASYPLALVRTRMQAQASIEGAPQPTMLGLFRHILSREGVLGLYRGIAPNFMKVIPAVSISYVVYATLDPTGETLQ